MNAEFQEYSSRVATIFAKIAAQEREIGAAAAAMARHIADDGVVHVVGPGGHSNIVAEELFWRAGGLAPINAMLDGGINLSQGAKRSNHIERLPGYAISILDAYRAGTNPGEIIIIANAYGVNAMTIDMALEAKRRGMVTIGITSREFADRLPVSHPARHPNGRSLYREVDFFIDCHLPYGDAIIEIDSVAQKTGPVSTLCNVFAANLLIIETVKRLVALGVEPPLWMSANLPGGDSANRANEEKYRTRLRHLG